MLKCDYRTRLQSAVTRIQLLTTYRSKSSHGYYCSASQVFVRLYSSGLARVGPAVGSGLVLIIVVYETAHLLSEIIKAAEAAQRQDLSGQGGKPQLNLIKPRSMGGREVKLHPPVLAGQQLLDLGGLMGGIIIQDKMQLAVLG